MISSIRIGLWDYKLKVLDEGQEIMNRGINAEGGDVVEGITSHYDRTIIFDPRSAHTAERDNLLLHELFHAINYQLRIGLTENQCLQLANGWESILVDNPDLMDIMGEDCIDWPKSS